MFVRLSNRDDLPELWSPTTTSYGKMRFKKSALKALGAYLGKRDMLTDVPLTKFVNLS